MRNPEAERPLFYEIFLREGDIATSVRKALGFDDQSSITNWNPDGTITVGTMEMYTFRDREDKMHTGAVLRPLASIRPVAEKTFRITNPTEDLEIHQKLQALQDRFDSAA